jgi:hypothetical protein
MAAISNAGKLEAAIYIDNFSQQWIVRDPDGNFWMLPPDEHPWDHREPIDATDDMNLESVPGHYKYMLDLPF